MVKKLQVDLAARNVALIEHRTAFSAASGERGRIITTRAPWAQRHPVGGMGPRHYVAQ